MGGRPRRGVGGRESKKWGVLKGKKKAQLMHIHFLQGGFYQKETLNFVVLAAAEI